jgi:hypothetical protein
VPKDIDSSPSDLKAGKIKSLKIRKIKQFTLL